MINERINALVKFLGYEVEEVKESYREEVFETPEGEYLVLTEEEADEEAKQSILNLIDDIGIQAFSESAQEYILNNFVEYRWFEDAIRETYQYYIDDIREESASDEEYKNRLDEEMAVAGVEDEEEFLDWLCENAGDPVEYYRDNFGKDDFNNVVKENDLINWDEVAQWSIEEDGRGNTLGSWDGEENEYNGYYIYRLN